MLVGDALNFVGPAGVYFMLMLVCTLVLAIANCGCCGGGGSGGPGCCDQGGPCECMGVCCPCCVNEQVGGRTGPSDLLGSSAHGVR